VTLREETTKVRRCVECKAPATHVEYQVDDDGALVDEWFYCAFHGELV
jgi:hypothetical protein